MTFDAPLRLSALIIALMMAAGVLDAMAFTYSAAIWREGKILWPQLARSAAAFALGIAMYWAGIRYLGEVGVVRPEIQTLVWFTATIVGVTLLGGRFFQWPLVDQIIAVNALASLGWLMARTSE